MFKKAGKLTESWKLLRECKKFLEENDKGWKKRTKEDTARIREEEKLHRLGEEEKEQVAEGLPVQGGDHQAEREDKDHP